MNIKPYRKLILILFVIALLFSNTALPIRNGGLDEVQAFNPIANVILGLFKSIHVLNKRNHVYREAEATQEEINDYYDSLISQTKEKRKELIKQVTQGEASPQMTRTYVRAQAALEAERDAAIKMTEANKKQARHEFNRGLVKEVSDILIASPGGQKILKDAREQIWQVYKGASAIRKAAQEGKPIDALTDLFHEKMGADSSNPFHRALSKNISPFLGLTLGFKLDRALEGALTEVENAMDDVKNEMGDAIDLLSELDSTLAEYEETNREPVSLIPEEMLGIYDVVDQTNATVEVVAAAYVRAAELNGDVKDEDTQEDMRERIRDALLNDRLEGIKETADGDMTGKVYCSAVGWGQYKVAVQQMGKDPSKPDDPETSVYVVCYTIPDHNPIFAKIVGQKAQARVTPTAKLSPTPEPTATPTVNPVPHGTYKGTTDYKRMFVEIASRAEMGISAQTPMQEDEIRIVVSESGFVHGTSSAAIEGEKYISDGFSCPVHHKLKFTGWFEGNLTGPEGTIYFNEELAWFSFAHCPDGLKESYEYEAWDRQVEIEISGEQMTITTLPHPEDPEGELMWSVTLTKQ